jgi:enoyl-CoA hydratase/carnithine racemase
MVQEFEGIRDGSLTVVEILESITEDLQEVARLMRRSTKVIIAAVGGYSLGAGCEIALDCDLIVASEDARFGFPESHAAMSITGGITQTLPLVIGLARARELILTGRLIDAAEAHDIGMVARVVPSGQHEAAAAELARGILKTAPLSVVAHKRMLNQAIGADFETVLNLEKQSVGVLCTTEDALEAAQAFSEKRAPSFIGR